MAMKHSISSDDLQNLTCRRPFQHIEVQWDGTVFICSPSWMPTPIGNLFEGSLEQIWNSEKAESIRDAILQNDFSHCSNTCPHLAQYVFRGRISDDSPLLFTGLAEKNLLAKTALPKYLNLAFDFSCQIACPMCRSSVRTVARGSPDWRKMKWITDRLIDYLPHVNRIKMLGSGEPLQSASCLRILNSLRPEIHSNLKVTLNTNGLLLDSASWNSIRGLRSFVDHVIIGVDAATAETYSRVRNLGDFSKLTNNLSFLFEKLAIFYPDGKIWIHFY
jgi:radical SAM protein with 4Fe4S-binding SPASM domain